MSVELPKDAEGREIPLDVEFLYSASGEPAKPYSFTFRRYDGFCWEMHLVGAPNLVYDPESFYLTPPDSWEKLLEDLDRGVKWVNYGACKYFGKGGVGTCSSCIADKNESCEQAVYADIASRIRKLRGSDE